MKKFIKTAFFIFGIIVAFLLSIILCIGAGAVITSVFPKPSGVIAAMILLLLIGINIGAACEVYSEEKRKAKRRSDLRRRLKAQKFKATAPVVYVFKREDWLKF